MYVDNNSIGTDVWFDNVAVQHYSGSVLEEDHYYPYGLNIAQNAAGPGVNPYKYQGKELERSFGLEMYDFEARKLDPQLGRFMSIDPHAEQYASISTFASMANNPVSLIDPNGKDATMTFDKETNTLTISAKVYFQGKDLPKSKEDRQKFIDQVNTDLQTTFKDGAGQSGDLDYNIKFDISAEINEDIKKEDLSFFGLFFL